MCIFCRGRGYGSRGVHFTTSARPVSPADIGPIPPRSCPDIGPTSEKQILSIGLSEIGTTSGHPVGCRIHGSQRCIVMRHHILHNLIVHIIYSENKCQTFLRVELLHNFTKVVITNSPNSFGISFGDSLLFYPPAS